MYNQDSYGALIVSLYRNDSIFFEGEQPVPVWVVICVGVTEGSPYCALFDNEADARAFYVSEVGEFDYLRH